ncbi:hypothetical protein B0T19DRAFT_412115 [Cercophora scortea]|uniref:Chromo domain-containing protein n=1 Tax=Cercophora scortea TaxID=314031 RepID=A0AAE0MN68_9PEZI|nr:hypothetical protein B0T19DRAFT_412115 [Cercophora scortea]
MPFLDEEPPVAFVQSDIRSSAPPSSRAASEVLGEDQAQSAGPTVIRLEDEHELSEEGEEDTANQAPVADMGDVHSKEPAASATLPRKRGRPSLPGSTAKATPAKTSTKSAAAKTPLTAKSATAPKSSGRKRAIAEVEAEAEAEADSTPAVKRARGRPAARSATVAASARLSAKAAKVADKPTRGRPRTAATTAAPAKAAKAAKAAPGRGRPKKEASGDLGDESAGDDYEVEQIVDSAIDADTMEHKYLVKWKNYPASQNTWEPKKNLAGSLSLVHKFDAEKKKKTADAAKTTTDKGSTTVKKGRGRPKKVQV